MSSATRRHVHHVSRQSFDTAPDFSFTFNDDGTLDMDFEKMAIEYWVRAVPGSLVEVEDEKQLRILNQMFIPLSQAMPALAAAQDQQMLASAAKAMQYIIKKQIELSGSSSAKDIGLLVQGDIQQVDERDQKILDLESEVHSVEGGIGEILEMNDSALRQLQAQIGMIRETQEMIMGQLGMQNPASENEESNVEEGSSPQLQSPATVMPASA